MSHLTHVDNPAIVKAIESFQSAATGIGRAQQSLDDLGLITDPGMGDWDHIDLDLRSAQSDMFEGMVRISRIAHPGDTAAYDAAQGVVEVQRAMSKLNDAWSAGVPTDRWGDVVRPDLSSATATTVDAVAWLRDRIQPTPRYV